MNTSSDELDDPFDIPWYIEEEIDEANDIADFYDRDEYYLEKFTEFDLNICNFSAKHLRDVKLLNSSVLPVIYDDRFYSEYITNDKADKDDSITNQDNSKYWTKLAYHRDTLVGALFCKIEIYNTNETLTESQTTQNIYAANVHTLACLPTYRRRGIGSILLNKLIDFCKFHNKVILEVFSHIQQSTDGPKGIFKKIYLHCQTNNDDAIQFYKKFKFEIAGQIEGYYRRMESPDAYRMELNFS